MSNGEMTTAKQVRMSLGGDILISMVGQDEFPIGNTDRVCKVMQEFYESEGFVDQLLQYDYTWRPTVDYWRRHFKQVRSHLRKDKKLFLAWVRSRGATFAGSWQFVKKGEFVRIMDEQRVDLETRAATYNEAVDDGRVKWSSLETPNVRQAFIEAD